MSGCLTSITLCIIFLGIIIIILTISLLLMDRYNNVKHSISKCIDNDIFGNSQNILVPYIDSNITFPIIHPDIHCFDVQVARYCADLINRVVVMFCNQTMKGSLQLPDHIVLQTTLYYDNNVIGFIGSYDKFVFVVFRGTVTEQEWKSDFQYSQVKLATKEHSSMCHAGFMNVYSQMKEHIAQTICKLSPDRLFVAGHSLGASLATLVSLDHYQTYNVHTYVFGSPRVCDHIPHGMSYFWRINNTCDIVTQLPLSVMPNKNNKSSPYVYTHGGANIEFTLNMQNLRHSHSMNTYIRGLEYGMLQ